MSDNEREKAWESTLKARGTLGRDRAEFNIGWDAARAADAEQIANLRGYMANLEENRATTELETRELEAENTTLTQQVAAVRADLQARADFNSGEHGDDAWWRGHVQGMKDALFELDRILAKSPVTPESRARLTARNLPQRSQHDFDIATGRPLGPAVTPESGTNRD